MQEHTPGEVITPQPDTGATNPERTPVTSTPPTPTGSIPEVETKSSGFYRPDLSSSQPEPTQPEEVISWEADEYIAHDKNRNWYVIAILVSVLIGAVIYLLTRDVITTALAVIALVGLAAFSARPPRRQQFVVAPDGIQVGNMLYMFADFRSFAVIPEKTGSSLMFVSLKRFVPAINIYVPEEYEQSVIDMIASTLPMESHTPDAIERFMSRIRF